MSAQARPIEIVLTNSELFSAASVGVLRRLQSISKGYDKNVHAQISNWATDIDGAAAEMAVSRVLGRYWSCHANNLHGDDVMGGIQVRSTTWPSGKLILRKRDQQHAKDTFVLVITTPPVFKIVGAIRGSAAMVPEYFQPANDKGGEGWWVPQDRLERFPKGAE